MSIHAHVAAVLALTCAVAMQPARVLAQAAPYRADPEWLALPAARALGSVSDVAIGLEGHIWIAERCGANSCAGSNLAPIIAVDASGRWLAGFGADKFVWPHGLHVDPDGNVWVTDGRAENGRGHQVHKFSPAGELLLSLGVAGLAGPQPDRFDGPTDVAVAANGDIFVSDGHETESNNRIVKFAGDGRYLASWGGTGDGPGRFNVPHALALDSQGRVFVADRNNNRIQIFDQQGLLLDIWTQFGRPSGIFVDAADTLYVADNQSNTERNPGWPRGIRIGSAQDGIVQAFIPDPDFDPARAEETSAHGVAADAAGNVYGAEVWSQTVRKYIRD